MSARNVEVQAEVRKLVQNLENLKRVTGMTWPKILKKYGRLLAVSFAHATQPFGDDDAARKRGEGAIIRDLRKVVATPSEVYDQIATFEDKDKANAFYAAYKARKFKRAEKIMHSSTGPFKSVPMGAFHPSMHKDRFSGGRVRGSVPSVVVLTERAYQAHQKKELAKVGWAKGAWAACALHFGGTRGITQWVTRHRKRSPGRVVDKTRAPKDPNFLMRNLVKYAGRVMPDHRKVQSMQIVQRNMTEEMLRALAAAPKKAGF